MQLMQAHYGGEDAHFVSNIDGGALGVADGVGGWNDSGISPAGRLQLPGFLSSG